jgi:hypothetical protein
MSEDNKFLESNVPFSSLANGFNAEGDDFDTYKNSMVRMSENGYGADLEIPQNVEEVYQNTVMDLENGCLGDGQINFSYFSSFVQHSLKSGEMEPTDLIHIVEHTLGLFGETQKQLTAAKQKIAELEAEKKAAQDAGVEYKQKPEVLFTEGESIPFTHVVEAVTRKGELKKQSLQDIFNESLATHPQTINYNIMSSVGELSGSLCTKGDVDDAQKAQKAIMGLAVAANKGDITAVEMMPIIEGLAARLFAKNTLKC